MNSWAGQILIDTATVRSPTAALTDLAGRFRAFANLGKNTRRRATPTENHHCFPNFHQQDYGNGLVYGSVTVHQRHCIRNDVLASDMGGQTNERPAGVEKRVTNANHFAWAMNYGAALPTFHQTGSGTQLRYGIVLFPRSVLETTFLVSRSLPSNPDTLEEWFRAANDYAVTNGFSAGFPTGKRNLGESETFTYPMMLCAFLKPGIASSFDCNYSIASVLGSPSSLEAAIAKVNYVALDIPPLAGSGDAVPALRIEIPT
jgi:hypothetical protein